MLPEDLLEDENIETVQTQPAEKHLVNNQTFLYPFSQMSQTLPILNSSFNYERIDMNQPSLSDTNKMINSDFAFSQVNPELMQETRIQVFPEYKYAQAAYSQSEIYQETQSYSSNVETDLSIKKPKKTFQSKEEQTRYIEGFRTKYKTEICKNWELAGFCPFEASCSFAHGIHELNTR